MIDDSLKAEHKEVLFRMGERETDNVEILIEQIFVLRSEVKILGLEIKKVTTMKPEDAKEGDALHGIIEKAVMETMDKADMSVHAYNLKIDYESLASAIVDEASKRKLSLGKKNLSPIVKEDEGVTSGFLSFFEKAKGLINGKHS